MSTTSVTINLSNIDNIKRPNPIIVKKWLVDRLGCYLDIERGPCGPGWNITWWNDKKQLFWTITFEDDDLATEFALRFL